MQGTDLGRRPDSRIEYLQKRATWLGIVTEGAHHLPFTLARELDDERMVHGLAAVHIPELHEHPGAVATGQNPAREPL